MACFVRSILFAMSCLLFCGCQTTVRGPAWYETEKGNAGPATEAEKVSVLRQSLVLLARLHDAQFLVMHGAATFCPGRTHLLLGIAYSNGASFGADYESAAAEVLGSADRVTITHVAVNSPAEAAGIRQGDVIQAIGYSAVENGTGSVGSALGLINAGMMPGAGLNMKLDRAGQPVVAKPVPVPACDFPVMVQPNQVVDIENDGSIYLTSGMLRYVADSDELAVLLAHALAHHLLNHPAILAQSKAQGEAAGVVPDLLIVVPLDLLMGGNVGPVFTTLGGVAAVASVRPGLEIEADRLSLYILANGGFDMTKATEVWQRIAKAPSWEMAVSRFHPVTEERIRLMQATIAEIARKRAAGLPLKP